MNLLSLARFLLNWNIIIVQIFYFLGELIISCLNSVEALWLIDAVTLLGALLLNSVLFHIFFTHPKMEGIFFIHIILWRTIAVRCKYRRIPNWYIIRMHSNDIKSLSSKGSAPTTIKSAAPILFSKINFGKRS